MIFLLSSVIVKVCIFKKNLLEKHRRVQGNRNNL